MKKPEDPYARQRTIIAWFVALPLTLIITWFVLLPWLG